MEKHIQHIVIIVSIIFFSACSALNNSNKKTPPDWITTLRSNPTYYQGVGFAPKQTKSSIHYEQATNEALKALASEISVEISASTLHIAFENDMTLHEDFTSVIEARINTSLEGYEKVDSYETKKGYWVLYRLSKQKYAEQQTLKRTQAIQLATTYFIAGEEAQQKYDLRNAIVQYAKTLDALKSYFNEPITVKLNGKNFELINETYKRIYSLLSNIEIIPATTIIQCKSGYRLNKQQLNCQVRWKGKTLQNFPLIVKYSENAQQQKINTDTNGNVELTPIVKSQKTKESIEFSIDNTTLLLQSATDFSIRKWLQKIPTASTTVELQIKKPTISIISTEKNLEKTLCNTPLKATLTQLLQSNGYKVNSNADFEITINANTQAQNQVNGIYSTTLTAQFIVKKTHNQQIVEAQTLNTRGTQLSFPLAGEKAYEEATRQISSRLFPTIKSSFLKTE